MPVHKVEGGYQWGEHGHVYPTREGAEKQAAAAHANGYRGDAGEDMVSRCAGILFRAPGPLYLMVRRADNGIWEQPGGHAKEGESFEEAAVRESTEETGAMPDGLRWAVRHNQDTSQPGRSIDYATFVQDLDGTFEPRLSREHTEYMWACADSLPDNLHPETRKSIYLLTGNELDIALRIREGQLDSPQHYENIWLFDLRVTGTGTSYRSALDEFVYRPPERFLTQEFMERCQGLPLIFEHPEKNILNTDEYRERAIGTVIQPYLTDDEVRGIAKVYDDDAAHLMMTTHASTSPAVVFRDAGSTESIEIDNGQTVLIEGKPSYIDHLAVCADGVWDKGNGPTGINLGDSTMPEENKETGKKEDTRQDEAMPAWADAIMKRMDAIEGKGGDGLPSENMRIDKKRKDAEEKEEKEEKERKDAVLAEEAKAEKEREAKALEHEEKLDAQATMTSDLKSQIDTLNKRIETLSAQPSPQDRDIMAAAQARAEQIARCFGDSVTGPLAGETPISYRIRLASRFQKHCGKFKDIKLDSLEAPVFEEVEKTIYADAQAFALSPAAAPEGRLIPEYSKDSSGRTITRYTGDPMVWMKHFMTGSHSARILKQSGRKEIN